MPKTDKAFSHSRKRKPYTAIRLQPQTQKSQWDFVEVWIDPLLSPPYLLLLMGEPSGSCHIHDPADSYKVVFSSDTYDEAQTWLLEDEYEPVEGRVFTSDL